MKHSGTRLYAMECTASGTAPSRPTQKQTSSQNSHSVITTAADAVSLAKRRLARRSHTTARSRHPVTNGTPGHVFGSCGRRKASSKSSATSIVKCVHTMAMAAPTGSDVAARPISIQAK